MSGKLSLYGLMVCVIASVAAADVEFEWSPVQLTTGQTTTIELFVSASPGSDIGIGSIILFFSDSDPSIQLIDFRWIDELKQTGIYFASEDLPDVAQTVYTSLSCLPPTDFCVKIPSDGSALKVAELDVRVSASGSFLLDAGTGRAEFASAEGQAPLTIDDGLSVKLTVSVDSGGNDDPGSDPGGGGGGGQEDNDNADDSTDEDEDGDDSTEDTNGDEDNANDDGESGEEGEGGDETDAGADELGGDDEGEGEDDSSGSDTSTDRQDESTDVDDTLDQIDGEESDDTVQPPRGFCGLGMIGFGFFTFGALSVMKLHRRRAA
ncbi:MAG: hypothetical protein IID39_08180 [Planctomycetes bacterium]|nr:hypothetical protein [Planctomycetota bacterium]